MSQVDLYLDAAERANTRRSYASAIKYVEVEWGACCRRPSIRQFGKVGFHGLHHDAKRFGQLMRHNANIWPGREWTGPSGKFVKTPSPTSGSQVSGMALVGGGVGRWIGINSSFLTAA